MRRKIFVFGIGVLLVILGFVSYLKLGQNLDFQLYPLGFHYFGHRLIKLSTNYSDATFYYASKLSLKLRKKFNIK